ncbi:MAG: ECF transporter S component [Clostridiales Family XIII bacterium]|jgi:riboflavin transporter FmnP|nr:ECF transporter S component [Clostridiales Family XIII bacterium]
MKEQTRAKDLPTAADAGAMRANIDSARQGVGVAAARAAASGAKGAASRKSLFSVKELTTIALLGVLSYLLMLIRFPLPFMPPFMDFDFAAVPELIGVFLLGPVPGVFIVLIKLLIKMATVGTGSAFTGEIINFMLSCCLILVAWIIYNTKRTKRTALIGMISATAITAVVACFANIYLIFPLYANLYGLDVDKIIGMVAAVNPYVKSKMSLVMLGILPFNIIKNGVAAFLVFVVYNRLVKMLKHLGWR